MPQRIQVRLRGIVQGVGFRPFVYHLAQRLNLAGYVRNDSSGLIAEVEGEAAGVEAFLEALGNEHPPLAWIQDRVVTSLPLNGESGFRIRPSVAETGKFALISPDIATCAECLADCTDPGNRRRGHRIGRPSRLLGVDPPSAAGRIVGKRQELGAPGPQHFPEPPAIDVTLCGQLCPPLDKPYPPICAVVWRSEERRVGK